MFLYHKSFDWRLLQYSRSCLLASSADPPALIPCKKKIKNQAQLFVQGLKSDVRTRNKRTLKPTQKRLSSQTVFPEQLFGDLVPIVYVWEHGTHPVQTQQTFFFFFPQEPCELCEPLSRPSHARRCAETFREQKSSDKSKDRPVFHARCELKRSARACKQIQVSKCCSQGTASASPGNHLGLSQESNSKDGLYKL